MASKLEKLSINSNNKTEKPQRNPKAKKVADSWDEDDSDSGSSTEGVEDTDTKDKTSSMPGPPPPTPSSPRGNFPAWNAIDAEAFGNRSPGSRSSPSSRDDSGGKRQEKSTAVASRLIAAGLGVKAPKRTEEQRAYDRAAKENEIKKKNRDKELAKSAEAEDEKAKAAVWG